LTENLEDHEKIKVMSKVIDEVKLSGQAPQEVQWKGSFRSQIDGIYNIYVSRVEQLEFDAEKLKVKATEEFSKKQLAFEETLKYLEEQQ